MTADILELLHKMQLNVRLFPYWLKEISILALYFIAGGLTGYVSYGHQEVAYVGYSIFLLFIFCVAKNRKEIYSAAFAYYLVCSRGIPNGSEVFFTSEHSYGFGILLWVISSVILAIPYAIFRFKDKNVVYNIFGLSLVFLSITLLPLGIIGWASPFNSAGIFFSGSHFFGFIFLILSVAVTVEVFKIVKDFELTIGARYLFYVALTGVICLLPSRIFVLPQEPKLIEAVSTHLGVAASARSNWIQIYEQVAWVGQRIKKTRKPYILFPETSAGAWTSKAHRCLWWVAGHTARRNNKTIIIGAEIPKDSQSYDNCLVLMGVDTKFEEIYYKQRVPVPISMWKPWSKKSFKGRFFANGNIELPLYHSNGIYLICYEQFIPWTFLRSMCMPRLINPTFVIAASNLWWCSNTNLGNVQRQTVYSLAALFELDVAYAVNK